MICAANRFREKIIMFISQINLFETKFGILVTKSNNFRIYDENSYATVIATSRHVREGRLTFNGKPYQSNVYNANA